MISAVHNFQAMFQPTAKQALRGCKTGFLTMRNGLFQGMKQAVLRPHTGYSVTRY